MKLLSNLINKVLKYKYITLLVVLIIVGLLILNKNVKENFENGEENNQENTEENNNEVKKEINLSCLQDLDNKYSCYVNDGNAGAGSSTADATTTTDATTTADATTTESDEVPDLRKGENTKLNNIETTTPEIENKDGLVKPDEKAPAPSTIIEPTTNILLGLTRGSSMPFNVPRIEQETTTIIRRYDPSHVDSKFNIYPSQSKTMNIDNTHYLNEPQPYMTSLNL